jgi:hypothetical protein
MMKELAPAAEDVRTVLEFPKECATKLICITGKHNVKRKVTR